MTARSRIRSVADAAGLVVLLAIGPAAARDATLNEPLTDDYQAGDYGRLRDAPHGVAITRSGWNHDQGFSGDGQVNAPIFPGDETVTDADQRAEFQLADGTLVWVDRHTELTFLALPAPYAEVADRAVLQLAEGHMRLATALGHDQELRVDTPSASIYPIGDADLRIDAKADGGTVVHSRRGVVEVVGNGGSVLVRSGSYTGIEPGAMPLDPQPYNTFQGDGFDSYVAARGQAYEMRDDRADASEVYGELPDEVQPHFRELSAHGSWVHADGYGYVWQPAGVDEDWRPYHDGYWGYGPQGYFWVSNEPWGWAPYHYGRWSWIGGHGWCWSPGRIFGGAWVSWSWGSAYVGWSPLDYWDYPAYRSVRHYGFYDPFCWTFVSFHHFHNHGFHHRGYRHYSAPWGHVRDDARRAAVVTRPPRIPPKQVASSPGTRTRAVRDVSDDPSARVLPRNAARTRDGSTGRSFAAGESRALRREAARAPDVANPPAPSGRARTVPASARSRSEPSGAPDNRSPRGTSSAGRVRLPVVTRPSRSLTPSGNERATAGTTPRRTGVSSVSPRGGTSSDAATRQPTSNRVRDIYRKMSKPRQTRDRPEGSRDSSPPKSPGATRRPAASRSGSTAAPGKSEGARSGSSGAKRTPARSRSSSSGSSRSSEASGSATRRKSR